MDKYKEILGSEEINEQHLEEARGEREALQWLQEFLASPEGPEAGHLTIPPSATPISDGAHNLIVEFEVTSKAVYEKKYQKPIWPKGASGVTIGIGYDVGYASKAQLWDDWRGAIPDAMIERLEEAIGVTGQAAKPLARRLAASVTAPWEPAIQVHRARVMPRWVALTERALSNPGELSAGSLGALVSLTYNRGASFKKQGDRYREMRAIRTHMEARDFAEIPDELRSMVRLWPALPGLQRRRKAEAKLFEDGLGEEEAASAAESLDQRRAEPVRAVRGLVVGKVSWEAKKRYAERRGGAEVKIGEDERTPIDDTKISPYSAICCLRQIAGSTERVLGTGWLAGPSTVVTAAHCIRFEGPRASIDTREILVIPGRDGNERPFGAVRSTRFSVAEGWMGIWKKERDLACIHLDEPVGQKTGWLEFAHWTDDKLKDHTVNICGYPDDRWQATRQLFDDNIIELVESERFYYLVDTTGGQSGAPGFAYIKAGGPPIVVGVHTWGGVLLPGSGQSSNSATRITAEFENLIRKWVEGDNAGSTKPKKRTSARRRAGE